MYRNAIIYNFLIIFVVINGETSTPSSASTENYNETRVEMCQLATRCVAFVSCPAHVRIKVKSMCKLASGREGVCCSSGGNHTGM